MKKIILMLGLASAMSAFTGCTKDEATDNSLVNGGEEKQPITLVAKMAGDGETRTAMGTTSAVWSAGDRIALYADVSSAENFLPFDISAGDVGATTAGFILDEAYAAEWQQSYIPLSVPFSTLNQCVAIYPYSSAYYEAPSNSPSDLVRLGALIPSEQTYKEGTFDNLALPMIALSTETEVSSTEFTYSPLNFKYMGAVVRLQLASPEATTLEKIEMTTGSYTTLTGRILIDFNQSYMSQSVINGLNGTATSIGSIDGMTLKSIGKTSSTITLTGPIELGAAPKDIYFVVLPNNYKNFTFKFYKANGEVITKSLTAKTMKAGELAKISMLNLVEGDAPTITIDDNNKATWTADANAKSYSASILDQEGRTLATRNDLDPATGLDLSTLDLGLERGNHALTLQLTIQFKDRLSTQASAPFTYYSKGIAPSASYDDGSASIEINNWTKNYAADKWIKVDYAIIAGKAESTDAFAEAAFSETEAASFQTGALEAGTYTCLIRAWYDTNDTANGYTYTMVSFKVVTYDLQITATVNGRDLTIVVTKGVELITNIADVTVGMKGKLDQGYALSDSNWNAATSTITMKTTDLEWWDDGFYTIQVGIFDYATFSYSTLSNPVTVEFIF